MIDHDRSMHEIESRVSFYNRLFPVRFDRAEGFEIWDDAGNSYIDFLSCAGALNYGHNPEQIRDRIVQYLQHSGISASLDMMTSAKYEFLDSFQSVILSPRGIDYKVQFPGPTGTNAVEAALKLARLVTGREVIVCFTNAFHGVSTGSLAVTGSRSKRRGVNGLLGNSFRLPYQDYADGIDTPSLLEKLLLDASSGLDLPAAIILETVQGEGGVNVASPNWLVRVTEVARRFGILIIVDDIQAGCGRTGTFFSFENMGFTPDIICLSKSLSAYGFPMSAVLIRPDLDIWEPGQHNGTFRGNNLAFVAATAALQLYWANDQFAKQLASTVKKMSSYLGNLLGKHPQDQCRARGRGMMRGLEWRDRGRAVKVSQACFKAGLIVETCGADDQVLKLMPPLTITEEGLVDAFEILDKSIHDTYSQ